MPEFTYTGGLQFYTIPLNVYAVRIRAEGVQGGNFTDDPSLPGGRGASMQGDFSVTPGETLTILVGGAAELGSGGGGGGGSFNRGTNQ